MAPPTALFESTYGCWANMNARCFKPECEAYPDYGGRGITVCDRWRDDFDAFVDDMGPKPEDMTLERVDVNGNYDPFNCIWASRLDQSRNQRSNIFYTYQGQTKCIAEWAEEIGIDKTALAKRLKKYPIERALDPAWLKRAAPEHGTVYMYTRKKCRCDLCRANWAEYQARNRLKKKLEFDL